MGSVFTDRLSCFQKDVCSQETVARGPEHEQSLMAPITEGMGVGGVQLVLSTDASGRIIHGSQRLGFLLDV